MSVQGLVHFEVCIQYIRLQAEHHSSAADAGKLIVKALFHVTSDAVAHIKQHWQRPGERPMLVSLVAELEQQPPNADGRSTIDEIVEKGKQFFDSLLSPVTCRWVVTAFDKERVPSSEVHEVDGVLFALPEETIALIADRSLIVDGGELRFDPELEPFQYTFKDREPR